MTIGETMKKCYESTRATNYRWEAFVYAFRCGWDACTKRGAEIDEQILLDKQKGKTLCDSCDGTGWVPEEIGGSS